MVISQVFKVCFYRGCNTWGIFHSLPTKFESPVLGQVLKMHHEMKGRQETNFDIMKVVKNHPFSIILISVYKNFRKAGSLCERYEYMLKSGLFPGF